MPEDVRKDFLEASLVSIYSSKAAAALLRLSLQKLCKHLGQPGKNINEDIRALAKEEGFSQRLVKAADTVRIIGNNAVHPGEMNDEDIDDVCHGLFQLVNLIVSTAITEPKKWNDLYDKAPESKRLAAEKQDAS
ncbi:hypothetical protein WH95_12215 [Kiloniella litopenaei]|uniref:DUF4145 domain-containing protein n=2 Tax=Kiloniella litopenaei TaxID=1549748 RepID=A0A0M2R3V6_9PROT|nr:hypothetical protein WH95_12215 [Kiloniella litopenaei]